MISILYVAAGGALGAVCRHGVNVGVASLLKQPTHYGTLTANVLGCLIMGALVALFARYGNPSQEVRLLLTVGFLGAFTTFSTFSLETVNMFTRGDTYGAAVYVFASVILSVSAVMLGSFLVWKVG